jgi:hypothetical protein
MPRKDDGGREPSHEWALWHACHLDLKARQCEALQEQRRLEDARFCKQLPSLDDLRPSFELHHEGEEGCETLIDRRLPSMRSGPGTADGLLAKSLP